MLVYQDTLLDKELGPVLETENFLMPPDEMIGLCLMANGIAAGFAGNQVMFSEAFLPYALAGMTCSPLINSRKLE